MFTENDILHYFETSAINYYADNIDIRKAIGIKQALKTKNVKLVTSPVSLWEILITSNEERKEFLIFFMQNFFEDKLLKSPSELVINYIKRGCPRKEDWFDIESNLPLAETWKDICNNPRKTFIYDKEMLKEKTEIIRSASKQIYNVLEDDNINKEDKYSEILAVQIEHIYKNIEFIKEDEKNNEISSRKKKLYKISIILIISILILYMDFDPAKIKDYWNEKNITNIEEQINYIFKEYEVLIHRGPFIEMAQMAMFQFEHGKSRGIFWDCLHSLYLPYVAVLFSKDEHFIELKKEKEHPLYEKITECEAPQAFA